MSCGVYTINEIKEYSTLKLNSKGQWVPVRPKTTRSFWHNVYLSYRVFMGQVDILTWPTDDE